MGITMAGKREKIKCNHAKTCQKFLKTDCRIRNRDPPNATPNKSIQ